MSRIAFVEQKVGMYEIEASAWKQEHESAIVCYDLDELLNEGVHLYGSISRFDENWHSWQYQNPEKCLNDRDDIESRILRLYQRWLATSRLALQIHSGIHEEYEARGFERDLPEQLRANCNQVESFLGNQRLVMSDGLRKLRDAALKEHREGKTVVMEEMTN